MSIKVARQPKTGTAKVTFSLPSDFPAGAVSVVGTFNDWTPGVHPLKNRAGGVRTTSVTVPAGTTLRFRYLGAGGAWFDDADATPSEDGGVLEV
ncbi:MAG: glycoside hydrolase family 13 domain protein [Frankiales bacterium]|jgi:1,4-alpha-glucan branching enzyme|nr:glycoside hydrolase family 13 domain protein [Frankiales bacterium]